MRPTTLKGAMIATATEVLGGAGWKKRAGAIYTRELDPLTMGWLGLNTASRQEPMMVNVFVGLRHREIEARVAELRGEKLHAYEPATISIHVGYLMPDPRHLPLVVAGEQDLPAFAGQLRSLLERPIGSFLDDNRKLEAITRRLEEPGFGIREVVAYRYPVALWLLGRPEEALTFVEAQLARLGAQQNPAASEFRSFSRTFVDRLRAGNEGPCSPDAGQIPRI